MISQSRIWGARGRHKMGWRACCEYIHSGSWDDGRRYQGLYTFGGPEGENFKL